MHLVQIERYPLKSCKAQSLESAYVGQLGIEGDRQLILAELDGRFITARTEPALLQVELESIDNGWIVRHPRLVSTRITREDSGRYASVDVWGRRIRALRIEQAEAWFSELLGRQVYLLHNTEDASDQADKRYPWGPIFSDGYPLLVCNTASLDALNLAANGLFEMARFRANLVISTHRPWVEDDWQLLRIGDTLLRRQKPCERCVLVTRDPETGEKDPAQQPLRALAKIHRGEQGEVLFGQNFSVEKAGRLKLGDKVELLSS